MFPEIRSSPKTNKKLNRAIRRSKVDRQYYGNLKQRAETQGQTVRQMLNKTKRLESTCPLDDQTSTDLMTIDHDREPEFNQQDDSATNNTDLEAYTPGEANKTAGANITIRAEIHHKSNDTDIIIYEATPIQDLDAAKPTDEITVSTVPTDEILTVSTVPTNEISTVSTVPTEEKSTVSTVPTDEISTVPTVPTDEISTVPTEEKSTVPTDEIPADEAWEKIHYCQHF